MKIGIVIPWREQPSRIEPFNIVVNWYKNNFPDAKIYFPDYPDEKWMPSHTRNLGVRMAENDGCDLIIMNDADTIPMLGSLKITIDSAYQDTYIHNPYSAYILLSIKSSMEYIKNNVIDFENWDGLHILEGNAGVWVFKPESWWALGGMDEKFVEWGYEDTSLEYVHEIVKGVKFKKHFGKVFALQHDPQPNIEKSSEKNFKIYSQYLNIKDKDELLKFVKLKTLDN